MDESRFNRGSWLVLGVALLLVAVSLGQLVYRVSQATDGWMVDVDSADFPLFTYNVLGEPSPLQEGDLLLAVGGQPSFAGMTGEVGMRNYLPTDWRVGGTAEYTIDRGGRQMTLVVPLYRWRLGPLLGELADVFLLTMLVLAAMALLVFIRQPGNWGSRALLMVSASAFALALSSSVATSIDALLPSATLTLFFSFLSWATLLWPSFFLLSISFPRPKRLLAEHPWLTLAITYSVAPIALVLAGRLEFGFDLVIAWSLLAIVMIFHSAFTVRDAIGRAQLRWAGAGVTFGAAIMISVNAFDLTGALATAPLSGFSLRFIVNLPIVAVFGAPAIGFAIAILRYRLFDIDVIIRRTLVYSVLTALLALVYLGSVLVLQAVFGALLGNSQNSLVAVLSTLAIAALFVPLRARVQGVIDRRFFRQKYDAARTLTLFSTRLRDEVDLDRLSNHLATVANDALEPAHVSLWLRPQGDGPPQNAPTR